MAYATGNQLWRLRKRDGRRLHYETPEALESACTEYFQWVEDNPIVEEKISFFQGIPSIGEVRHCRAMIKAELYVYLGIDRRTWDDYKVRNGFSPVCEWTEDIIYGQKFTGAAANVFNHSIIARDLGLRDIVASPTDDSVYLQELQNAVLGSDKG